MMRPNKEAALRTWWDQRLKDEATSRGGDQGHSNPQQRRGRRDENDDPRRGGGGAVDCEQAKAYVDYRFRQCLNPASSAPLPDAAHPLTNRVVALTDRVLEKELKLLQIQIDGEQSEIDELRAETEALSISSGRLRELNAIFDSKVRESIGFERRLADLLQSDEALTMRLQELEADTTAGWHALDLNTRLEVPPLDDVGALLEESSSSPSARALNMLETRVRVQKALTDGERMCPMTRYLDLLNWTSELSQLKHRMSFDRIWCESAMVELSALQKSMDKCVSEADERDAQVESAKAQLDAAQKAAFSLRKDITMAHKTLTSDSSHDALVRQITADLSDGVMTSLLDFLEARRGSTVLQSATSRRGHHQREDGNYRAIATPGVMPRSDDAADTARAAGRQLFSSPAFVA